MTWWNQPRKSQAPHGGDLCCHGGFHTLAAGDDAVGRIHSARILGAEAREFTKKQRFNQQKTRHLRPKT